MIALRCLHTLSPAARFCVFLPNLDLDPTLLLLVPLVYVTVTSTHHTILADVAPQPMDHLFTQGRSSRVRDSAVLRWHCQHQTVKHIHPLDMDSPRTVLDLP
jgi:hypothetical protein